ncbi:30S ribosomal protein S6 [Candidatus Peregrinibacteria bacterium]|nr:30S ribosomal protein S6 [Candidatus Peregrinibacteria bacterium]MBI3816549.1 30S ribosomal protein S6 [Candidatus Peregrinibacteria bacterium]
MSTLTPTSEDTRIYELCLLYPASLAQKDEQTLLKEVEEFFTEAGAKQVAKDVWGQRGLAYPIKGTMEGKIIIYYEEMDPGKIREIDQNLKIHKSVLRHLFVKPPKHYQILKYSELYEEWMKTRESVSQVRAREKEEKLKERVVKKAQRQAKVTADRAKTEAPKPGIQEDVLTEKLEKLISDENFDL